MMVCMNCCLPSPMETSRTSVTELYMAGKDLGRTERHRDLHFATYAATIRLKTHSLQTLSEYPNFCLTSVIVSLPPNREAQRTDLHIARSVFSAWSASTRLVGLHLVYFRHLSKICVCQLWPDIVSNASCATSHVPCPLVVVLELK